MSVLVTVQPIDSRTITGFRRAVAPRTAVHRASTARAASLAPRSAAAATRVLTAAKRAPRKSTSIWLPLTILSTLLLAFGGAYGYIVFSQLRNSAATEHAVTLALANKTVGHDLGAQVQVGYFVGGNIYDHGDGTGNANLTIEVKGANGSGILYAMEHETDGQWYADKLTFRPDQDLEMIQVPEPTPAKPAAQTVAQSEIQSD